MDIQLLRTNETGKATHLIADSAKDVGVECKRVVDTEQYGWIARRHFDDVIFGISIFMVLLLIVSVIAVAFYTVT
jgi:menaquinone-dependent protoporphyrinogen IX oxidase